MILKSDKSARAFWSLAKVEELLPSEDGVVRAAKVRVVNQDTGKSFLLRRPIQHLIPLEIRPSYSMNDGNDQSKPYVENVEEDCTPDKTNNSKTRKDKCDNKYFLQRLIRTIQTLFKTSSLFTNCVLLKRLTLGSVANIAWVSYDFFYVQVMLRQRPLYAFF